MRRLWQVKVLCSLTLQSGKSKSISNVFSVPSAAEMMEQNAVSQALNTMVRRHQHFDWGDLAIAGAAGGIIGSNAGRKVSGVVKSIDKTGIVNSHVNALTTAGVQSAATGAKFSATQVVEDNMGHSMGNAVVNLEVNSGPEVVEGKEVYNTEDKSLKEAYQNYQASQLEGGGYTPSKDPTGYERLSFHSDLVGSSNNTNEIPRFESKMYWSESLRGVGRYINNFETSVDSKGLSLSNQESYFDIIQKRVFGDEGGISNHKNDHGGYTNKGITIGTFKKFAKEDLGLDPTEKNLAKITDEQSIIIYKKRFWSPSRADEINSFSLAYTFYDFYINSGQAVRVMQKSVNSLGGNLHVDNIIGSKTIKAINSINPHKLFDAFQKGRINHYIKVVKVDPTQKEFLKGWIDRTNKIKFER